MIMILFLTLKKKCNKKIIQQNSMKKKMKFVTAKKKIVLSPTFFSFLRMLPSEKKTTLLQQFLCQMKFHNFSVSRQD